MKGDALAVPDYEIGAPRSTARWPAKGAFVQTCMHVNALSWSVGVTASVPYIVAPADGTSPNQSNSVTVSRTKSDGTKK